MSPRPRELKARLAKLNSGEQRKLYKRASKLRKASQARTQKRRQKRRGQDGEELERTAPMKRRGSLDEWVLRLLDEELISETEPWDSQDHNSIREGWVTWVGPASCRVRFGDEESPCMLRKELAMTQRTDLAVGDRVCVSGYGDGERRVEEVLSRATFLSRPDPRNRNLERVIAANMDRVVVVASVKTPPFKPRLLDRFLIAIERGGAQALICINKMDLLAGPEEQEQELSLCEPYRQLGLPVLLCSAVNGQGIAELRAELAGQLCVFVGHSGVGKSSLLNALHPELRVGTGEVRDNVSKGRHTTTASTLYHLPQDIRIMDTPGIRAFGLWQADAETLADSFVEFRSFLTSRAYSDCSHTHEPGCGVKQAVEAGSIAEARYRSYLDLVAEL
ncbi:MAG: ribosome small subunit-dependent GTPase A [Planctomycetota bacterium]